MSWGIPGTVSSMGKPEEGYDTMRKGHDTRCTASYLDGVGDCDREWMKRAGLISSLTFLAGFLVATLAWGPWK